VQPYLLILAGALAVAVFATPVLRRVAALTGFTDPPSERKAQGQPVPLLGGAALYLAVAAALFFLGDRREVLELAGILVGATVMAAVGFVDDRRSLDPRLKLAGQALAALLLVRSGIAIQLLGNVWLDGALTVIWVLMIANAFNFMDNMDGVAGGVGMIAAAWYLLMALDNGQLLVAPLAAAVTGACAGFLVHNFSPATIFMGDTGSLFLGFLLAAVAIKLRFPGRPIHVSWMVPVLVSGPLLLDLGLVTISRVRRGVNPLTTAGRDHLSHRLVALGATPREAALAIYLLAGAFGMVAFGVSHAGAAVAWAVMASVAAGYAAALWRLEFAADAPRPGADGQCGAPAHTGSIEREGRA